MHLLVEYIIAAGAPELPGFLVDGPDVALEPAGVVEQLAAEVAHVGSRAHVDLVPVPVQLRLELEHLVES